MMLNLITALDPEQYEIYVISKPNGPLVEKLKESGFYYIPVPSLRRDLSLWDFVAFIKIYQICRKYRFDIVHTHSSKTGFIGRIAARLAGIPKIIHTVHGFPFHQFQPKIIQKFYIIMEKIATGFCDKVVFVNEFERELAIKDKIVKPEKAITIFNGIKIPEIQKNRFYHESDDHFLIGSVSRFSKQKNVINLIKVAIKVCQKNNKIKFVFIGDGEDFFICKRLVNKANMSQKIILEGWSNNVLERLLDFDVFLLFSRWEGLPISILEAMSIGLPIIASDIKGNNELVSEENGILIDVEDVDKLESVLIDLPNRNKDLKKWGENSRKIVSRRFNFENFIDQYEKLYTEI